MKDELRVAGESEISGFYQPQTDRIVAIGSHDVSLIDRSGKTVRTIRRRSDGTWLAWAREIAFAPDGSLAILADTLGDHRRFPPAVCLYRPHGDPICTITLPKDARLLPQISYNGQRLVVTGENALIIYDGNGTPLQRSSYPANGVKNRYYRPFILPGGRAVALFDGSPVLRRYELP